MATITRNLSTVEARRSLESRAKFWHVAIVSLFFVAVVGSGLFLGTVMVIGTFRSDGSSEMTAGSRTGRIARSMPDGKLCHYIVFDNRTATAVEDRTARRRRPTEVRIVRGVRAVRGKVPIHPLQPTRPITNSTLSVGPACGILHRGLLGRH